MRLIPKTPETSLANFRDSSVSSNSRHLNDVMLVQIGRHKRIGAYVTRELMANKSKKN